MEVDENVKERLVMKDFHLNQRNLREDGDVGDPGDNEEEESHRQGVPCHAQ